MFRIHNWFKKGFHEKENKIYKNHFVALVFLNDLMARSLDGLKKVEKLDVRNL